MPRVYELPTHLEVEDQLIAGLTARQMLRLAIGASLAYSVSDRVPWLPEEVRLALALALAAIGVVFALLQPAGRALDQWLLAGLLYLLLPRRLVWRAGGAPSREPSCERNDWAELELHPDWVEAERGPQLEASDSRLGQPRPFEKLSRVRSLARGGSLW